MDERKGEIVHVTPTLFGKARTEIRGEPTIPMLITIPVTDDAVIRLEVPVRLVTREHGGYEAKATVHLSDIVEAYTALTERRIQHGDITAPEVQRKEKKRKPLFAVRKRKAKPKKKKVRKVTITAWKEKEAPPQTPVKEDAQDMEEEDQPPGMERPGAKANIDPTFVLQMPQRGRRESMGDQYTSGARRDRAAGREEIRQQKGE